jgi:hypothetical protein
MEGIVVRDVRLRDTYLQILHSNPTFGCAAGSEVQNGEREQASGFVWLAKVFATAKSVLAVMLFR